MLATLSNSYCVGPILAYSSQKHAGNCSLAFSRVIIALHRASISGDSVISPTTHAFVLSHCCIWRKAIKPMNMSECRFHLQPSWFHNACRSVGRLLSVSHHKQCDRPTACIQQMPVFQFMGRGPFLCYQTQHHASKSTLAPAEYYRKLFSVKLEEGSCCASIRVFLDDKTWKDVWILLPGLGTLTVLWLSDK